LQIHKPPDQPELLREIADTLAKSKGRWLLLWLPGLMTLACVILLVLHFGEIELVMRLLNQLNFEWLPPAILIQFATYICAAGVWWRALNILGHRTDLRSLVPLGFAKLFIDQALPTGGVSGALLVVFGMVRRAVPFNIAFTALLAGMIAYYAVYGLCALVSIIILAANHKASAGLLAMAISLAMVAIAIPAFVLFMRRKLPQLPLAWFRKPKSLRQLLSMTSKSSLKDLRNFRLFAEISAFHAAVFLLDALTLAMALRMIGVSAPLSIAFAAHVLGTVASTLGIIPLGLGTFEGGVIAVLALANITVEAGLSAVLLTRVLTFWAPMLPGLWMARKELQSARIAAGEPLA
jgi:glycosyltransferase 2 family protein